MAFGHGKPPNWSTLQTSWWFGSVTSAWSVVGCPAGRPFGKSSRERKDMRSLTACFALLVGFIASGLLAQAQNPGPANKTVGSASVSASEAEVNELRNQVAAQQKT